MEKLLVKVEQNLNWRQDLKKVCRRNKVPTAIASSLNPLKIRSLYQRFKKIYSSIDKNKYKSWVENQLRTFYWLLIAISFTKQKLISDFDQDQFSAISQIFWAKDRKLLQYETIRFIDEKKTQTKPWNSQENQIFLQVMKKNTNNNKWNDIARQLFQQSNGKYFRSGKQCRQRWNNHLDPSKHHGDWSQGEDALILKFIYLGGKKWSQIARILGQRTEHMVKNRFKSLVIKYKKQLGKNANQSTIIQHVVNNSNGQIAPQHLKQLIQLQKNYNQKNISLRNRSGDPQKTQSKPVEIKSSSNLKQSLPIINQHDSQSDNQMKKQIQMQQQQECVSAFNKGFQDEIIKQITQCKQNQIFNMQKNGSFNDLQMISSPAMWHLRSHNSLNTPGLFNFSPNSPLLNSFSQFERNMNYKWIEDDFGRSTTY